MDKKQQIKIAIYSLLIIILGVVAYYYYNYLQEESREIETSTQKIVSKKLSGKKLDAEILKDKKFKELQRIIVEESPVKSEPKEDVASIPLRHSNPFKPF